VSLKKQRHKRHLGRPNKFFSSFVSLGSLTAAVNFTLRLLSSGKAAAGAHFRCWEHSSCSSCSSQPQQATFRNPSRADLNLRCRGSGSRAAQEMQPVRHPLMTTQVQGFFTLRAQRQLNRRSNELRSGQQSALHSQQWKYILICEVSRLELKLTRYPAHLVPEVFPLRVKRLWLEA
jgi:hypothetical protein